MSTAKSTTHKNKEGDFMQEVKNANIQASNKLPKPAAKIKLDNDDYVTTSMPAATLINQATQHDFIKVKVFYDGTITYINTRHIISIDRLN